VLTQRTPEIILPVPGSHRFRAKLAVGLRACTRHALRALKNTY
jgi:hypothetical protein